MSDADNSADEIHWSLYGSATTVSFVLWNREACERVKKIWCLLSALRFGWVYPL